MTRQRELKIKARQGQRRRIARSIRHIRQIKTGQNKIDALSSLLRVASNYKKIRG